MVRLVLALVLHGSTLCPMVLRRHRSQLCIADALGSGHGSTLFQQVLQRLKAYLCRVGALGSGLGSSLPRFDMYGGRSGQSVK